MKRVYLTTMMAVAIATASADTAAIEWRISDLGNRTDVQGALFNRDVMGVANMGILMQNYFQYGTARSMAMAGAMTSLGGDGSAMMINPAGLAMSRSNDLTITPLLTIQNSQTNGTKESGRVPMTLSNITSTINLYEGSKSKVVSVNFGFGYNKIADYNYNYSASASGAQSSVANLFSRQLTGYGVSLSELYGPSNPYWNSLPSNIWGAALAYKSGMTFQKWGEEPDKYSNSGESIIDSPIAIWDATWLDSDATVDQYYQMNSEGSTGEYDIAFAANVDNKLYLGVTLGLQDIYQSLDILYSEYYPGNKQEDDMYAALNSAYYNQTVINSGSGCNIKVGATYRPTDALRIGVAYHSPTWYNIRRQYQASVGSTATQRDESFILSDVEKSASVAADSPLLNDFGDEKWRFRSSSRVLVGASYTFAKRALLSVDYQRDWCGSMKMTDVPYSVNEALYSSMDTTYQSVNIIRVGGEYKLMPQLALRCGYGCSSSMVKEGAAARLALLGSPVTTTVKYGAMGIGYAFNNTTSIDLTYMFQETQYCEYTLFYSDSSLTDSVYSDALAEATDTFDPEKSQSSKYTTKIGQHNIAFSLIFRM